MPAKRRCYGDDDSSNTTDSKEHDKLIRVGKYQFHRQDRLGRGGFGTVYKAIKEMDMAVTPLKEMKKEIRILKKVYHENVVLFMDYKYLGPFVYIVTEYCDSGDLAHFLYERGGAVPEILPILLKQVGSGIKFLQEIESIHRDIKSSNILLHGLCHEVAYNEITFKIADFGLARTLKPRRRATTWCGTPSYMEPRQIDWLCGSGDSLIGVVTLFQLWDSDLGNAPEILLGQAYDGRVDMWSLGVIAYECVMGQLPFEADSDDKFIEIYEEPIKPKFSNYVDSRTKYVITRMLAVNPEERISIDDLLAQDLLYRKMDTKRQKLKSFLRGLRAHELRSRLVHLNA